LHNRDEEGVPYCFLKYFLLGVIVFLLSSAVYGRSLPAPSSSAGVVEREVEREYDARPFGPYREIPLLELDIPEEQLNLPNGQLSVWIESIYFEGNTVFSSEILREAISTYLNQSLCMGDIREVCLAVQELYVRNGYFLARAYPPPQRIENGLLTIQILEGILGKVTIEGNCFYPEVYIYDYFKDLLGLPIKEDRLMKTLFLLNENSDLEALAVFVKGETVGAADLVIKVHDQRPVHFYANMNNFGTHATSRWRTGGRMDYGSLVRTGDTLSIAGVFGYPLKQLWFADVNYTLPINKRGDFLSAGFLYSDSVVNQFQELNLKGRSEIAGIEFQHALQRTRMYSSDCYFAFEYKQIYNFALHQVNSVDKLRVLTLGLEFDAVDRYDGRTVGDISFSAGIPDFLGGSHAVDSHSSRQGAGGRFFLLNADIQHIHPLPYQSFFLFDFSGQLSATKLPLPEQFYIGGVDTVRGYSMAAALGDDGYVINAEVRVPPYFIADKAIPYFNKTWGEFIQLLAFIDHGGVYLKNGQTENQRNFVSLTGIGAGIRIFAPYGIELSCDIGIPLTKEKRTSSAIAYLRITWMSY